MIPGSSTRSRSSVSASPDPSAYRADLDGLRAIAVAAVVLYHVELSGFSGGYVGVDVFFVLSGYLISRLIKADVEAERFRLSDFYLRRMRRLFPALAAMSAGSFVVAAAIYPAPELEAFVREAASALLSLSNFVFWQQSGYFAADAYSKPLLHTWSLGIEEQFYLIWPVLWVLLLRFRSGRFAWAALLVMGAGSLGLAEVWLGNDPAAAFFLLPARIVEFCMGAMLVFLDRFPPVRDSIRDGSTFVGVALILFSVLSYDEWTRFPASGALIPCLGAALVIAFGSGPITSPLLCHRASVALGRISYSLYLVHWPLIVFYRYWTLESFVILEKVVLVAVAVVLAILLHRGVEARWRVPRGERAGSGSIRFAKNLGFATALLLLAFVHVESSGGWKWRYPASAIAMGDVSIPDSERTTWTTLREVEGRPFSFREGDQRVLVIGDSQAGDFINMLVESGEVRPEELSSIVVIAECGTVFVEPEERESYFAANRRVQQVRNTKEQIDSCMAQWDRLFSDPRISEATHIYVSNLWYDYHLPFLEQTANELRSISDARIRFVGNKSLAKEPSAFLATCFRPKWLIEDYCGSREQLNAYASRLLETDEIELAAAMEATLDGVGVDFLDLYELVCPEATGCGLLSETGRPIYFDRFHTTRTGNRELANRLGRLELHDAPPTELLEAALDLPD